MSRQKALVETDYGLGTGAEEGTRSFWKMALHRLLKNKLAVAGLAIITVISLAAILAPVITKYSPTKQDYSVINASPGREHWLGTDYLGRDAFSRLVYGARTSLMVGIFTQLIILGIALPIGSLAGYAGGSTDNLLMRFVDIIYAFPDILFVLLLRTLLGGSILMIFLAIGLVAWTGSARLIRGQILATKSLDYVLASRSMGASDMRVIVSHILPNAIGPLIVAVAFGIPRAIFIEAALSYIGIGVRPPTPSWGTMIQDGYSVIFAAPHLVLFPAIAIALVMMSFTFLGDGIRDALDPRLTRGR